MSTDMVTVREVPDHLRIAEKTAYRLVANGALSGFERGGSDVSRLIAKSKPNARNQVLLTNEPSKPTTAASD